MSIASRPRVLIADDHVLVAEGLKNFLTSHFNVVAVVHDGQSLLHMAQALRPEIVVADIGMPVLNGLDAGERVKRILPSAKLIFLTVSPDPDVVVEAFRRGASGYLLKNSAPVELVSAIRCVLEGKAYISPELCTIVPELLASFDVNRSCGERLTERQVEVLQLLAEGKSLKEAGAVLNLTARTIAFHKYRIMNNLHLRNDADIVQYALRTHVVFP
jgi:DNA-binding NarL/FixJ family response regulator